MKREEDVRMGGRYEPGFLMSYSSFMFEEEHNFGSCTELRLR